MPEVPAIPLTFQDRIKEKIKNDIGTLLTDDDLSKLIASSLHEMFFEKVRVQREYSSYIDESDPIIYNTLRPLLTERVDAAVKAWLSANESTVTAIIDAVICRGIHEALIRSFEAKIGQTMWDFGEKLKSGLMLCRPT